MYIQSKVCMSYKRSVYTIQDIFHITRKISIWFIVSCLPVTFVTIMKYRRREFHFAKSLEIAKSSHSYEKVNKHSYTKGPYTSRLMIQLYLSAYFHHEYYYLKSYFRYVNITSLIQYAKLRSSKFWYSRIPNPNLNYIFFHVYFGPIFSVLIKHTSFITLGIKIQFLSFHSIFKYIPCSKKKSKRRIHRILSNETFPLTIVSEFTLFERFSNKTFAVVSKCIHNM